MMLADRSGDAMLPHQGKRGARGDHRLMGMDETTVALFSAYYPSHGGGMELACADLADSLAEAGIGVEWVSQADGPVPENPATRYTPVPGTDLVYALSGVPLPIPAPWALPAIARAIRRADVAVIAEANFILSLTAFWIAKWHRRTVLVIQHVGEPSTVSKLARLVMRFGEALFVRPMLRRADAVVCVSPVVARHFADLSIPTFLTIGHGIDIDCFRPPIDAEERASDRMAIGIGDDRKLACFVGRLTKSKGIEIIAEIARLRPDWTFAIAGIGPAEPSNWGLDNVVALGLLERSEVARLYRASDVMLLPSPSESFSLVVREAMASGCGVLCSPQILETDPGLAPYIETAGVDLDEASETSIGIAAALDRHQGRSGTAARDYIIDHCAPDAINRQYVGLVESLAGICE